MDANISTALFKIWEIEYLDQWHFVLESWSFYISPFDSFSELKFVSSMFSCLVTGSIGFCWWALWRKAEPLTCKGKVSVAIWHFWIVTWFMEQGSNHKCLLKDDCIPLMHYPRFWVVLPFEVFRWVLVPIFYSHIV